MAQHDMIIDNQSAPSARSDLNDLFAALVSQNSGATEPLVTFANMVWVDTTDDLLKVRNEANSGWITVGAFDQTNGRYEFRGNVIQAITTAGLTFKGSGGGTILAVSNTGAVTTSGNIDGRSISTDGSKLDGIEAGADATDATNVTAAGALMKTGGTLTGEVVVKETRDTQYSLTGTAINPANGNIQYKTLGANTAFSESLADGQTVILYINDGSGYTITWPTITWLTSDGSAPTLETSGYNVIVLQKVGGTLYGKDVRTG